jgi:hypothetical protein
MPAELVAEPKSRADPAPIVEASLVFAVPSADKPYGYAFTPPDGIPPTRGEYGSRKVRIENVRPIADQLSLDVEGVAVVPSPTAVRDYFDEAQLLALGHPETVQLVKNVTGASRVVVFDYTLRRRQDGVDDSTQGLPRQPAARVHIDQTVWSGPQRVREVMGGQAEDLLTRRAAIINVWRPIAYAARDWPLALGDARSIAPADLVPMDLIFQHRRGEIYGVAHNPAQRWLYVPDLQPDEAVLIKCWDSDQSVARFTPHTAFADPTTPPGTPPRQSIEFRTMAFFD